jgi:hypothetical protein
VHPKQWGAAAKGGRRCQGERHYKKKGPHDDDDGLLGCCAVIDERQQLGGLFGVSFFLCGDEAFVWWTSIWESIGVTGWESRETHTILGKIAFYL